MGCNCKQRNTQPEVRIITPEPIPTPIPLLTEEQMEQMTLEEQEHWDKLNNQ